MKYADTVQRLGRQARDTAALFYDKQFRLRRQDSPELLPWDQLNGELFNQALSMGLVPKTKGNFGNQRKQTKKKCTEKKNGIVFDTKSKSKSKSKFILSRVV